MINFDESPAFAMTRAGMTLPTRVAFLPAVDGGRVACAVLTTRGQSAVKGTGMPCVSPAHVQKLVFGQASTRNPYTDKTRAAAIGGGAKGPHPLREPEPV
jgi:hypothetical protein